MAYFSLRTMQIYVKNYSTYIAQFIKSPRTFGTLAPSSSWLCNRMAEQADWNKSITVAELGAGDGVLTRCLLDRISPHAQLDAWEIEPVLAEKLNSLAKFDSRLRVLNQSAEHLDRNYDVIFSCLPLLSIPLKQRLRIIRKVCQRLTPDGVFIQFQYSPLLEKLLSRYFKWERVFEVRNIPPAWVYVCTPIINVRVMNDDFTKCNAISYNKSGELINLLNKSRE